MSIPYHERPGVYVEYDTLTRGLANTGRTVGIAAQGTGSQVTEFHTPEAATALGSTQTARMVQLALENGAARVLFCPVPDADYEAAVSSLLSQGATAIAVDSTEGLGDITTLLEEHNAICFAGTSKEAASALAQSIDHRRIVLLSPDEGLGAAALAGCLGSQSDPSMPLNGMTLAGLSEVEDTFTDTEYDTFLRAGVTPLEEIGGQVTALRVVTTATDSTWRELTTICILDDVLPTLESALRTRFLHKKNNLATRNAIRAQTAMLLDDRVRREIIEDYSNLQVSAVPDNPTVCEVSFSFTVVHALCRIHLTAHIVI